MDKYRLVGEKKSDSVVEPGEEEGASEVRITQQGKPRNYISFALGLFVSRADISGFALLTLPPSGERACLFLCGVFSEVLESS